MTGHAALAIEDAKAAVTFLRDEGGRRPDLARRQVRWELDHGYEHWLNYVIVWVAVDPDDRVAAIHVSFAYGHGDAPLRARRYIAYVDVKYPRNVKHSVDTSPGSPGEWCSGEHVVIRFVGDARPDVATVAKATNPEIVTGSASLKTTASLQNTPTAAGRVSGTVLLQNTVRNRDADDMHPAPESETETES